VLPPRDDRDLQLSFQGRGDRRLQVCYNRRC